MASSRSGGKAYRRGAAGPCGAAVQQPAPEMNGTRTGMGWGARLLIALVLIVIGGAGAIWGLAHYQQAARFLGVVPAQQRPVVLTPTPVVMNPQAHPPSQA